MDSFPERLNQPDYMKDGWVLAKKVDNLRHLRVTTKSARSYGSPFTLAKYFLDALSIGASDPRDKIYSGLGIAEARSGISAVSIYVLCSLIMRHQ